MARPILLLLTLLCLGWAEVTEGAPATAAAAGSQEYTAVELARAKKLPPGRIVTALPPIVTAELAVLFTSCGVTAYLGFYETPVKGVRGLFETTVYVLDEDSGDLEEVGSTSGKFTTDSEGRANFGADLRGLFRGRDFGDNVLVFAATDIRFKNGKRVFLTGSGCSIRGTFKP